VPFEFRSINSSTFLAHELKASRRRSVPVDLGDCPVFHVERRYSFGPIIRENLFHEEHPDTSKTGHFAVPSITDVSRGTHKSAGTSGSPPAPVSHRARPSKGANCRVDKLFSSQFRHPRETSALAIKTSAKISVSRGTSVSTRVLRACSTWNTIFRVCL
jgi:hypothetical protein